MWERIITVVLIYMIYDNMYINLHNLIRHSATKSCDLDPIPTCVLKQCIGVLLPIITKIIDLSLTSNTMSGNLKEAILTTLIEQILLDPEIFKNFHHISNLPFISKLIERCRCRRFLIRPQSTTSVTYFNRLINHCTHTDSSFNGAEWYFKSSRWW